MEAQNELSEISINIGIWIKNKYIKSKTIQMIKDSKTDKRSQRRSNINHWLIDFNGMSTHLGLFYINRLGNHI